MNTINIIENQTLFDLAVEQTGSVLSIIEMAMASGKSITDDLIPQEQVIVPESRYIIKDIVDYFKGKNYKIATHGTLDNFDSFGGIGYWILEVDFQVK
ncbi:hypothetical protein ABE545_10615 [Sphingobacterium faecium]|uniref:hypothetical protein n=1 Tax=Sphingobacterium faecium TaxID=34087 RepID=UPI003208F70C